VVNRHLAENKKPSKPVLLMSCSSKNPKFDPPTNHIHVGANEVEAMHMTTPAASGLRMASRTSKLTREHLSIIDEASGATILTVESLPLRPPPRQRTHSNLRRSGPSRANGRYSHNCHYNAHCRIEPFQVFTSQHKIAPIGGLDRMQMWLEEALKYGDCKEALQKLIAQLGCPPTPSPTLDQETSRLSNGKGRKNRLPFNLVQVRSRAT
jgi:hypothetical protein